MSLVYLSAFVILLAYALIGTFVFWHGHWRRGETEVAKQFDDTLRALLRTTDDKALERIKVLAELAPIHRDRLPWYERAFSAIGVVAFFSMSLAAGVQTIASTFLTQQTETLRLQKEFLENDKKKADEAIARVSEAVVADPRPVPEWARSLLESRLSELEQNAAPT